MKYCNRCPSHVGCLHQLSDSGVDLRRRKLAAGEPCGNRLRRCGKESNPNDPNHQYNFGLYQMRGPIIIINRRVT